MGKITNAFERYQREKTVKTERLPIGKPEDFAPEEAVSPLVHETFLHRGFDPKLVVLSAPESLEAENFKMLKSQILYPKEGEIPKTIMVTSAFPGEGKTFVAANLAVSLAQGINEHVLLVDSDLRKPSLNKMLGYSNAEGLFEYLTGKRELSDLIIRTRIEKLSLLVGGRSSTHPGELLSSKRMNEFLQEVKGRYGDRFVILDATPSQITAETKVLGNYVDAIIFVVMAGKSPRETIQRSIEDLGKKKVVGIVFNGYSQSRKPYYKYYKRYYGKST
ncbi:MAG TPA: polysaccharide biosynthesis tyrosine autokinase [Desulfatiglandales bacterium]|nr:polysaccharide biosynthesis tyrosine autokinase [Desulfatiglandales bacterium]